MSRHIRSRQLFSPSVVHSPGGDCTESAPKRILVTSQHAQVSILDLNEQVIHQILSHINLKQIGILSQVSRQFIKNIISFLHTTLSIPVLFPSMTSTAADQDIVKFFISGSSKKRGVDMTQARSNFKQLGEMMKKLTCLNTTTERVMMSAQLMARLCPCSPWNPTSKIMSLCGVFFHKLVDGWTDEECILAARIVFSTYNSGEAGGPVSTVLSPHYQLGSWPALEMHVRNFLASVFFKEVESCHLPLWVDSLLLLVCPERDGFTMSRVLLLISSPAKEVDWQFGVHWADHVEAIPATYAVASSRYNTLVSFLNIIKQGQLGNMVPSILSSMFSIPSPWLPENVGSVLLLLGQDACHLYLQHSIRQATTREVCTSCTYKPVSTAVIGLALMSARFRWSFTHVFDRLEEVIGQVLGVQREELFRALWKSLADEVTDIRQADGEDWAMEGSMHLFKVIRMMGQMMTLKAYADLPTNTEERDMEIEE